MNNYTQYQTLIRPDWAPEASLFGPVWSILYILIIVSFGYVFYKYYRREVNFNFILPFVLNIIFNLLFTPIQFGLKNNLLASIDIILVLSTLVWLLITSYKKYRWVFVINLPYFLWVSFATILQITVTYLNW